MYTRMQGFYPVLVIHRMTWICRPAAWKHVEYDSVRSEWRDSTGPDTWGWSSGRSLDSAAFGPRVVVWCRRFRIFCTWNYSDLHWCSRLGPLSVTASCCSSRIKKRKQFTCCEYRMNEEILVRTVCQSPLFVFERTCHLWLSTAPEMLTWEWIF